MAVDDITVGEDIVNANDQAELDKSMEDNFDEALERRSIVEAEAAKEEPVVAESEKVEVKPEEPATEPATEPTTEPAEEPATEPAEESVEE